MGGEVGDLRAQVVLEQGFALEELDNQASEDTQRRRKTSHNELIWMTAVLLKTGRELEMRGESGGKQSPPTAAATGRDAASPSSGFSDGGGGSREGERICAEAGPLGDQPGRRGQERGLRSLKTSRPLSHTVVSARSEIFETAKNGDASLLKGAREL